MNHHRLGIHSNFYSIYLIVFIFNLHIKSCEQCKFNEDALWQKYMELGFLCEEGVHYHCFGIRNHFLSCRIVMHKNTSNGEVFYW
jgi:hypothetical protein